MGAEDMITGFQILKAQPYPVFRIVPVICGPADRTGVAGGDFDVVPSKWSSIVGFCCLPWYSRLCLSGVGVLKRVQGPRVPLKGFEVNSPM